MKTILRALLAASSLAALVSCGGGGDPGTSPFDPNAGGPSASNLTLVLSSSSINNSGAQTVTATATASTSGGQTLTGIPVSFSVDNGATFTQGSATTGANGQSTAVISIGANPSNRVITVRATSGNLSATAPFAVTGSLVTVTGSAIVAPGSTGNQVIFRLTNTNGAGIPGQDISVVAGTLGTTTGTTDTSGSYTYTYTAPTTAGSLDIVGTSGGASQSLTVLVQSGAGSILPAVGPINSASVSANPSVVATNTASTNNRTEIRALFVGAGNAAIPRVRVRFDLANDANNVGGTFSTGNNIIYSDANGIATTAYIPGARSSPTNGVTIRACYSVNDFDAGMCPSSAMVTVTVVSDPVSVTIGSNNLIITGPNNLTYRRQFVVLVVDSSGRAKGNVDIVPSLDQPVFFKGQYVRAGSWITGTSSGGVITPRNAVGCLNEDLNRNSILESSEDNPNGNSQLVGNHSGSIEPRRPDATITVVGTGRTDANGSAVIQVEYPQNVAHWLQIRILVSATGISGTEGRATWTEILPTPIDAITAAATPPFVVSPYGSVIDPVAPNDLNPSVISNLGTFPDGSPGSAGLITGGTGTVLPCNNPY